MRTSESTAKLSEALAIAQGVMKAPVKDKTAKAGSYSYSYADLARVFEALREPLAANGLSITQVMDSEEGKLFLLTRLLHASGEWVEGSYPIPLNLSGQQLGSALTYARRYSLSAIVGIAADDDDDGASAEREKPKGPIKTASMLAELREEATEAQRSGTLATFRADQSVKDRAGTLSPADLATFKQVIKDLAELSK